MQLETYSLKKAFALEKLNDINLNMLYTESILKLYTLEHYVILITAKRVICVQDLRSPYAATTHNNNQYNFKGPNNSDEDLLQVRIGSHIYKHWNIFFDDILKIKL